MKKYLLIFILFLNGCLLELEGDTQRISECRNELEKSDTCYYATEGDTEIFLSKSDYGKYGIVENYIPIDYKIGNHEGQILCTNLRNDEKHCGECALSCAESAYCEDGRCRCRNVCPGSMECNDRGACVCMVNGVEVREEELTTNENCGYCKNKCMESSTCQINPINGRYACLCSNGKSTCLGYGECAIDINGDKDHCGFCENRCLPEGKVFDNVVTEDIACVDAVCQYPCKENYENCNEDIDDGCETLLASSADHCGACGNNCANNVKNASGIKCEAGKCDYGDCKTNFLDLDNNRTNGCEFDASADTEHCGSADIKCNDAVGHASGIKCEAGKCDYDACDNNFLDLNNDRTDGCEYNASSAMEHCGSNNINCYDKIKNVNDILCADGICNYTECKNNFLDLNNDRTDGCEHDAHSDVNHCGSNDIDCQNAEIGGVKSAVNIKCRSGSCDYEKCFENWLDLDNNRANGCEHNAQNDSRHCGSADIDCNNAVQNASSISCSNGKCNYVSCNANFLDLDGHRANGCEVNTQTNVNHCGGQNKVCDSSNVSNATGIKCTGGKCDYVSCNANFLDLDGNRSNGCEVNTQTHVSHCGGQNKVCDSSNVSNAIGIKCTGGKCDYVLCKANFLDLDGNRSNGCEVNTQTDVNHCGGQNKACRSAGLLNTIGKKCVNGACDYTSCGYAYADSDNNRSNGCETDVSDRVRYCGDEKVNCYSRVKNAVSVLCNESGMCSYIGCDYMYIDYNGDLSDGCERATNSDTYSCSPHGYSCEIFTRNAHGIHCNSNTCDYLYCLENFIDLDGNRFNGCEVDLSTNNNHCGGEGRRCYVQIKNADDVKCERGACDYVTCKPGYADKDNNRSNGCESTVG